MMGFSGFLSTRPTYIGAVIFLTGCLQCTIELINMIDLSSCKEKIKAKK
ncbi:MAG: hypothetical protein LUE12_02240 [Ruminococcus sp.]|nr:hypothetical protein [Ruminococcus sp.]